jgi:hypothetical protein
MRVMLLYQEDQMSQPSPVCQILSAFGLTTLTDSFLVTTHNPKTRLTSHEPALLIMSATKSLLADVWYYNSPRLRTRWPVGTTGQPVRPVLIPNVTTRPNLLDIVCLGPYRPHIFVLGDHTWPQNASEKSTTSNTNKVSYQILIRRCGILHQVNPSLEELMYFLRVGGLWPPWWGHETSEPLTRERSNLIVGDSRSSLKIVLGLKACLESCVSFLGFS